MSQVNISNVVVLDNPSPFNNPFQFEITFECLEHLNDDLEWKIIYVSSAESEDQDQVLDSVLVGPVPPGKHMFVFQAPAPDIDKIPIADAVGVTVVLLTCSYRSREFIRVGYYVNNDYTDPEMKENPPSVPDYTQLQRNVLATAPRVTKFPIDWGDGLNNEMETDNQEVRNEMTESNQLAPPEAPSNTHTDFSKQPLALGHDSNSLNLSEPMAS
ncbi:histone chaperone asf1b-B-like [Watersipora subatra]|uniref:histone chaperone asf1b-B-like n=1 Tax=Watersipora subatra TaxID=2589382 RepID=UPI00355C8074